LSYQPNPINDNSILGLYLNAELQKLANDFQNLETDSISFKVWNAEPDKPRTGQVYYADGTNWTGDGSSGEGLYMYKSGGSWVFIG